MWEAFEHAGHAGLGNLIAVVDVNRLGQRGPTMHEWDTASLATRVERLRLGRRRRSTATTSRRSTRPTSGRSAADLPGGDLRPHQEGLRRRRGRGQARPARQAARGPRGRDRGAGRRPLAPGRGRLAARGTALRDSRAPRSSGPPTRSARRSRPAAPTATPSPGSARSTRRSSRSTARSATRPTPSASPPSIPERFFEMYIAEQQMVAAAVGLQTRGWKPFASSFGAFLSRAYDFIRMAAISDADLKLCGSHVGVSIGPDGPSQMALEDIAAFRAVLDSVVLYPSDANQTVQLLDAMREHRGFSYMRTTREKTPVLYEAGRGVRDRRQPHAALRRRRRRHPDRRRHHPARMPRGRRRARRQGSLRPGHRPLLGETGRRRRPC